MHNADFYKTQLTLSRHPEGGYYREIYRSETSISKAALPAVFKGSRNCCTSIYFLLEKENFSAFHRIQSDETWHFYDGQSLEVLELHNNGELNVIRLGRDLENGEQLQYTVKANTWFASRVAEGGDFSLVGCTVSPGFDFDDFEMADRDFLLKKYPSAKAIILQLTRI